MLQSAWTGAGQPDVYGINLQRFHQMKNFNFLFNSRVLNGGILQPIAQRLIVQKHPRAGRDAHRPNRIPVVDPFVVVHG